MIEVLIWQLLERAYMYHHAFLYGSADDVMAEHAEWVILNRVWRD